MAYQLVLRIPLEVALVSRDKYETQDAAEEYLLSNLPEFPGFEILPEDAVSQLTERKVLFPER